MLTINHRDQTFLEDLLSHARTYLSTMDKPEPEVTRVVSNIDCALSEIFQVGDTPAPARQGVVELPWGQIGQIEELLTDMRSALSDQSALVKADDFIARIDATLEEVIGDSDEMLSVAEWIERCAARIAKNAPSLPESSLALAHGTLHAARTRELALHSPIAGSPQLAPEAAADLFGPHEFFHPTLLDPGHPMQPVLLRPEVTGELMTPIAHVARFKQNPIIRYLLDQGPFDLNHLAQQQQSQGWSNDDFSQLAQLIGYSVGGYGNLSYARPDHVALADTLEHNLRQLMRD